jgi:RES domain-containing protein
VHFDLESHSREPVRWSDATRVQPWRHPESEIWTRLVEEVDLLAALALLRLTEPDLYLGLGHVERVKGTVPMRGEGVGWVIPAYTWGGAGRFNSDAFGCFYAAPELETSVAETVHHLERFLCATDQPPVELRMRVLRADIDAPDVISLLDVPHTDPRYHSDDYTASQAFGARVYAAGIDGILSVSVRRPSHSCLALYRPSAVLRCSSAEALAYLWDGRHITAERRTPIEW